jgi:hypothetical protein
MLQRDFRRKKRTGIGIEMSQAATTAALPNLHGVIEK